MSRLTRPSPSMGVALLALFISLGGVSYAVATGSIDSREIRNNSVRSVDVRNNNLRSGDIRNNNLRSRDVRNEDLTGADIKADSVLGDDIDESTLGQVPSAGTVNGVRFVQAQDPPVAGPPGGNPSEVEVSCAADEKAVGGGAAWIIPNLQDNNVPSALNTPITASMPVPATAGTDDATGWRALGRNMSGAERALRVYAICIKK